MFKYPCKGSNIHRATLDKMRFYQVRTALRTQHLTQGQAKMSQSDMQMHSEVDRSDDSQDTDCEEPSCLDCGGEGFVDSVSESSGRRGWDDDGPGTCPNCNGSGLRKDQQWF